MAGENDDDRGQNASCKNGSVSFDRFFQKGTVVFNLSDAAIYALKIALKKPSKSPCKIAGAAPEIRALQNAIKR